MKKILVLSAVITVAVCMYLYAIRNFVSKEKINGAGQRMVCACPFEI